MRQTHPNCRTCGKRFAKEWMRQVHCSFPCAYWGRVERRGENECWPWTGAKVTDGYGAGTYNRKRYRAHREILAEALGCPLRDGMLACHSCDNPSCCNPKHLFEGTPLDNMLDRVAKGRWKGMSPALKGEAHGKAKLTDDQVRSIWSFRHTHGPTELGKMFNIDKSVVSKINSGRRWSHITSAL